MKRRVRLQRQLIPGDMVRLLIDRATQIVDGFHDTVIRQRVHQVDIDIVKIGVSGDANRIHDLVRAVYSSQPGQCIIAKALRTQRQAVDACISIIREARGFDRARVRFKGDFGGRHQVEARPDRVQKRLDRATGKQTGRSTADEDAANPPASQQRRLQAQIAQQRVDIRLLRQRIVILVGIEIAIRAFANTPGQMHVQG